MGPQTYPEMLLVEMARTPGAIAETASARANGASSGSCGEWPRRLESGRPAGAARRAKQVGPAPLRLSPAIGSCGAVNGRCVQPPDAENRTSGGVGGWPGVIPVTRPDLFNRLAPGPRGVIGNLGKPICQSAADYQPAPHDQNQ